MRKKVIAYNAIFFLIFLSLGGILYDLAKYGGIKQSTSDIRQLRGKNRQPVSLEPNEYSCFSTHAYYGYTNSCSPSTSHGFIKEHSLQQNKEFENNKTFRVLVLGGSVASHLTRRVSFEEIFTSASKEHPNFIERFPGGITVFNAAHGGYKQPQQAIILITLLAEGYKFDAVVNIAGFNEIALPLSENKSRSISPILPRSQDSREEKEIAIFSPVATFIRVLDIHPIGRNFSNKIMQIYSRSLNLKSVKPYAFNIPKNDHDWYVKAKTAWIESSDISYAISKEKGIPYFEYIQPNQYLKGSKPLSTEELDVAIRGKNYLYRQPIENYYSSIKSEDFSMPKAHIFDARYLFSKEYETIYNDSCCHMNARGMTLIGKSISNLIIKRLIE